MRQKGSYFVVWKVFSLAGTTNLATVEATLDSEVYCMIQEECLLLLSEKEGTQWMAVSAE